jgi:hypothetical protein
LTIATDGLVGIGNTAPTQKLDITGNIYLSGSIICGTTLTPAVLNVEKWEGLVGMFNRRNTTGQIIQFLYTGVEKGSISTDGSTIAYNTTSDRRLKQNITESHYKMADLMKIQVRDFKFINDESKQIHTGFIAQELYEIYPEAVTIPEKDEDYWQVDYGKLTPLLVKAMQDQQSQIESQKQEIELLKAKIEAIEKSLTNK